jgi:Holliday junction resolvase-like predicted endonuclease
MERSCRFDVVLLEATTANSLKVQHIQNAFEVSSDDLH